MRWRFIITEESAGRYLAEAKRDSGDSISLDGSESVFSKILRAAYETEIKRGTFHGEAAYHITASFLHSWPAVYNEKMMGCWTVGNRFGFPRIDYDGRDSYLMVSERADAYAWQGSIERIASGYFNKLVELSEKNA
jgi:hypothetical protein